MGTYVVGIGESLWDLLPDGKRLGGAPANFAYHVLRMGLPCKIATAVGNDYPGDDIVAQFKLHNLDGVIERVDFPTGEVSVRLDNDGVPEYEIKESVAWDNISFTDELEQLAVNTRLVCFGSLAQRSARSRETIHKFLDVMSNDKGVYKVFDINLSQHYYNNEISENSLNKYNILKINDDEIKILAKMHNYDLKCYEEYCLNLLNMFNLKLVILTCGAKGSYVFADKDISYVNTPVVDVKDTVGAGDSFTASFCVSLLKGKTIKDAHKTAVNVSSYVCSQKGAMPEMPDYIYE